ncbi:MAG: hypothetical protein BGO49_14575 [Planctomycetales bacterium 71-10]|nr:MAG: hypothetical protein BGO49_14575 [Planctomycetales bacterium 71-10]
MNARGGSGTESAPDGPGRDLADLAADLADRLGEGSAPDLEALAREHPEQAERLLALLPTIALMVDMEDTPGGVATPDVVGARALGEFRLVRELGRGGMGVVYEAEDAALGRRVAVKVLPPAAAIDALRLRRFQLEARALASLSHAHIVPIYSVGCDRGVPYFAMRLVEGRSLAEVVRERRDAPGPGGLPVHVEAAALVLPVAEALAHAHGLGILHRDVKPANLLVDADGHPWITDFGMARLQGESDLTRTGDLIGTLRYMAPEQALGRGEGVDGRSDVYALGATLYELLTLRPAFDDDDRQALLRRILSEGPSRPRSIDATIPADLETLVLKAMAREPADRYASASELADDLRRFLASEPIRARPPGRLARLRRWASRPERVREAGAALVSLGLLTGGIGILFYLAHLLGIVRPQRPDDLVHDLAVAFFAFDAPPIACGALILAGRRIGLWLGLVTSMHFLAWLLVALAGWDVLDYGGLHEDKATEAPLVLLILLLVAHALARTVIGLAAGPRRGVAAPGVGGGA